MTIALMGPEYMGAQSLTAASLYFDRVVVLAPKSDEGFAYQPLPEQLQPWRQGFHRELQILYQELEDLGILREISLTREVKRRAAAPLVDAIADTASELRRVSKFHKAWPVDETVRTYTITDPFIPDTLREVATQEGIGFHKVNDARAWEWVRVPSVVGRIYYSALYELLAKTNMSSPVSEQYGPFPGASEWGSGEIAEILVSSQSRSVAISNESTAGLLGMASVSAVLPASSMTAAKINDIRTLHRAELSRFQNFVEEVRYPSWGLREGDPNAMRELILAKYEREVYPALVELRESIRRQKIEALWGALSIKTAIPPVVASIIGSALPVGPLVGSVGAGIGVALGVGEYIHQNSKGISSLSKESAHSYLLSLEKATAASGLERLKLSGPAPNMG